MLQLATRTANQVTAQDTTTCACPQSAKLAAADAMELDRIQGKYLEELRRNRRNAQRPDPFKPAPLIRYWLDVPADAEVWVSRPETVLVGPGAKKQKQHKGSGSTRRIVLLPNFCAERDYVFGYSQNPQNIFDGRRKLCLLAGVMPDWAARDYAEDDEGQFDGNAGNYLFERIALAAQVAKREEVTDPAKAKQRLTYVSQAYCTTARPTPTRTLSRVM